MRIGLIEAALDEIGVSNKGAMARLLMSLADDGPNTSPFYLPVNVPGGGPPFAASPSSSTHQVVLADPTLGNVTVLLPANPAVGDILTVTDVTGTSNTGNQISIDGNGHLVQGLAILLFHPLPASDQFKSYTIMFQGALGWRIVWTYPSVNFGPPLPRGVALWAKDYCNQD